MRHTGSVMGGIPSTVTGQSVYRDSEMRTKIIPIIAFTFCFTLAGRAQATHLSAGVQGRQSGAIKTISPATLQAGHWVGGLSFDYSESDTISDSELIALADSGVEGVHSVDSVTTLSLNLAYGITDDFTINVQLPYLSRSNVREGHFDEDEGEAEVERLGDSEGIGDLTVLGQYRFFNRNETLAALLAGVKLPTGVTDRINDEDERFETEFQPGSGSFDPLLGVAAKQSWGPSSITGSLLYTIATEGAQGTDLGDQFDYSLAYAYRIKGLADNDESLGIDAGSGTAVDLVLELNGIWRDQEEIEGEVDPNSGVNVVYISPGVSIIGAQGWYASLSVGVPISKNIRGEQDDPANRVFLSLGKSF